MGNFKWENKINDVDDIDAEDINAVANEAIRLENDKADKATTLAGYGITDAYTKEKADELLSIKTEYRIIDIEIDDEDNISANITPDEIYEAFETKKSLCLRLKKNYIEWYIPFVAGNEAGGTFMGIVGSPNEHGGAASDNIWYVISYSILSDIYGMTIDWFFEKAESASTDLSNVSDEAFLSKLNQVLPNGDEVSYPNE